MTSINTLFFLFTILSPFVRASQSLPASLAVQLPNTSLPFQDPDFIATEIVGGTRVPNGALPWLTGIRYAVSGSSMGNGYCTGALITTWPVPMLVTAGHCSQESAGLFTIFANRYDSALTTAAENGLEFTVQKIIPHPQFDGDTLMHDVAVWVLKLKSNPANHDLRTFPTIAINADPNVPAPGSLINIAGWGVTSYGSNVDPRYLLQATVPSISGQECVNMYGSNNVWTTGQMCTMFTSGTTPTDTCQGDSGSSVFMTVNGKDTMMGVTSWGNKCALANNPGVESRASYYYFWIVDTVLANGGAMPSSPQTQVSSSSTTRTTKSTTTKSTTKSTVLAKTTLSTKAATSTKKTSASPTPTGYLYDDWKSSCGAAITPGRPCNPSLVTYRSFCMSLTTLAWCEPTRNSLTVGAWVVGTCRAAYSCGARGNDFDSWCYQSTLFTRQPNRYWLECPNVRRNVSSPVKNQPDHVLPLDARQLQTVRNRRTVLGRSKPPSH
jgi:trypsin